MWLTPPGPYRFTTCRERELTLITQYFCDQTRTWRDSPDEGWAQCRDHLRDNEEYERRYTPFTHPFIPTRHDYDGQMIFGDLVGLKLPDICLKGEETPRKNLTQETCPDRRSNPGPLRDKRAWYRLLHSGGRTNFNCYLKSYWNEYHFLLLLQVKNSTFRDNTGIVINTYLPWIT